MLESDCGTFLIKKGEVLCGNIYSTQRDRNLFHSPDSVLIRRYLDNPKLKRHVLAFGGNFDADESFVVHKCIGQHLVMMVLKLVAAHLMFCDMMPLEIPVWTGRNIERLGCDEPIQMRTFKFHTPIRATNDDSINQVDL